MSSINYEKKEINVKVVYYGPTSAGKTTCLQYIFDKINPNDRGKMMTLTNKTGKTVFFDMSVTQLGQIPGFKVRITLHTLTGVCSNESLKNILKDVDGIVFVADSQFGRIEANQAMAENLYTNLAEQGSDLYTLPFVIQYNKRDLPEIATIEELKSLLNPTNVPDFESIAHAGVGVFDALKSLVKSIIIELKKGV